MNIRHQPATSESPAPVAARRLLLAGILSGYVCSYLPLPAAFATVPAATPQASADFLNVSAFLTGHAQLDQAQASQLYAALQSVESGFDAQLKQLADFISANKPAPGALQAALDEQKSPAAKLPGRILTAWYVGVVGGGKAARCITFETSLMYAAVADRLKPPSYAYGPYGSWGRNPLAS